MSLVEDEYNKRLDQMTGQERLKRAVSIYNQINQMLLLQVKRDNPELEGRKLQKALARRRYFADQQTLTLIDLASD